MTRRSAFSMLVAACVVVAATGAAIMAVSGQFSYDLLAAPEDSRGEAPSGSLALALAQLVLPLLDAGDTEYAVGFSEEAFSAILLGAEGQAVLSLLGEPLERKAFTEPIMMRDCPEGCTVWYYSRPGKRSENYFVRTIEFNDEDRVTRKFRGYYVD